MQTSLPADYSQTEEGLQANAILRSCVHCGLCNATCPTYQLTGNELDGPRGRIYLIKNHLENDSNGVTGLKHLDRCLTCLACETTCPSNVQFGHLLDIGRKNMSKVVKRPVKDRIKRYLISLLFSKPARVRPMLALARLSKPFLPQKLAAKIPVRIKSSKTTGSTPGLKKFLPFRAAYSQQLHLKSISPQQRSSSAPVFISKRQKVIVAVHWPTTWQTLTRPKERFVRISTTGTRICKGNMDPWS